MNIFKTNHNYDEVMKYDNGEFIKIWQIVKNILTQTLDLILNEKF